MKTQHKGKTAYTEKKNTHVPPGWSVSNLFAYGEVLDPMKMCCGKYFVEKYVEHNEDENIF